MVIGTPATVMDDTAHSQVSWGLRSQLPAAPARVLLVGQQTAALGAELAAQGYQVTQKPVCQPEIFAQVPTATRIGVRQAELALATTELGWFDAAIVLDVSPGLHPLALFDQVVPGLAMDATLLLVGSQVPQPPPRLRRWLDYVVAMGTRCGLAPIPVDVCADPMADGSFVRVFRKTSVPRWRLHHVRISDYDQVAALFLNVFGHPLSRELWEWKYANGRGNAVAASRNGTMVAHYGGIYRDVLLLGQPDWALQICDVMVLQLERGVMTRQGPFLLTAATSAELHGPLGFGFPVDRAMLVAEKMGLYDRAGQMAEVRWEPGRPGARLRTRVRTLDLGHANDRIVADGLWADMAHDLRTEVVGVRNWQYLQHRYCEHPHNRYELLCVASRLTGKPLGLLVLRRLETSCELMDVVGPLANLPLLIDQARRMTARWGLPYLYCWITTNQAAKFVDCGGKEVEMNILVPSSCWTDDPRVEQLKGRWWLTSGDTDFR